MLLYLAGALSYFKKTNQLHRAFKWRENIIKFCDDNYIAYFNPAESFVNEFNHTLSPKLIVDQNKYYLDKTDILLVSLDMIMESPGTQWEIFYASEVLKIPVIAIGDKDKIWSPHIQRGISQYCKDECKVIEILTSMFNQTNF
jgi:nucleoside 2-deoxyribosyltransferase